MSGLWIWMYRCLTVGLVFAVFNQDVALQRMALGGHSLDIDLFSLPQLSTVNMHGRRVSTTRFMLFPYWDELCQLPAIIVDRRWRQGQSLEAKVEINVAGRWMVLAGGARGCLKWHWMSSDHDNGALFWNVAGHRITVNWAHINIFMPILSQ